MASPHSMCVFFFSSVFAVWSILNAHVLNLQRLDYFLHKTEVLPAAVTAHLQCAGSMVLVEAWFQSQQQQQQDGDGNGAAATKKGARKSSKPSKSKSRYGSSLSGWLSVFISGSKKRWCVAMRNRLQVSEGGRE